MSLPLDWLAKLEAAGATSVGVNIAALHSANSRPRKTRKPDTESCILEVCVPLPPTTNNLYLNAKYGGRVPTAKYKDWKGETEELFQQLTPMTQFPISVTITINGGKGFRKGSDIANREKGIIDAIVAAGVIPDDSWEYVQRVVIEYQPAAGKKAIAFARVRLDPL